MLQEIKAKIRNMIKQGFISLVFDDAGPYPLGQVTVNGKASKYVRLSPYGLASNPPTGSQVLLFSSQGQESTKFGLANNTLNRKKSLLEGEAALFNEMTGAFVLMKSDGSIEVDAETSISITAPDDVTIKGGDLIVENDILCDGEVFGKASSTPYALTTHEAFPGNLGFNTGPPLPVAGGGVPIPSNAPSYDGNDNIVDGNGTKSTEHIHSQGSDSNGDTEVDTGNAQ